MSLTDTQRAIHAFIAERIETDGFAPSQAEIARAFGFKGVRAAQYHLEALEAAGIVERTPGVARSLRLLQLPDGPQQLPLPTNDDVLQLPVLGQVAAGVPIGADIGSEQVVAWIEEAGGHADYIPDRADCAAHILAIARPGDRIAVMGARDDTLTAFARDLLVHLD